MRRLLGLRDFVHDAIEKTTDLVQETHEAVAAKPIAVLSYIEPVGTGALAVHEVRKRIAGAVFDSIRATNRGVQAISDVGVELATRLLELSKPWDMGRDAPGVHAGLALTERAAEPVRGSPEAEPGTSVARLRVGTLDPEAGAAAGVSRSAHGLSDREAAPAPTPLDPSARRDEQGDLEAAAARSARADHARRLRRLAAFADVAESAFNAVAGDFLAARDNGLAIEMRLRHRGRELPLEPAALARVLPDATGKLCIFVHGLACSDLIWRAGGAEERAGLARSFGPGLARELGYTPLYVRYNTGLHISQNGRAFAKLMDELSAAYPRPIEEIALIGHSMGGLVVRSAAHYAQALDLPWTARLTHVLCIGSPHLGAPLEQATNAFVSLLRAFDVAGTQVPAKLLNARSAGIKDLRFGSLLDEDWLNRDPDAFVEAERKHVPFVDGVSYGYIAARLAPEALGEFLGDLLVQLPSASGEHRDPARRLPFHMGHVLEGVHHIALTTHPDVYKQVERFLRSCRGPSQQT